MNINERKNYLAILDMLLTVTMLSNNFNDDLDNDANIIIQFIGDVFKLSKNEVEECKKLITSDLTTISTINDVETYFANEQKDASSEDNNYLYLKTIALLSLDNIFKCFSQNNFNQYYFDYHYLRPYNSTIRYNELAITSIKGNVDINRTIAIMLTLGIGHKKDIYSAIYRLKQCAYWGDVTSLNYLSFLYEQMGDEKEAKLYSNLSELIGYASEGRTVLSKELKDKYDKQTQETFAIVTSIKQDIVLALNMSDINFSFLEVILSENIDYYKKIGFINRYTNQEWKEITNSSENPSKRFGFVLKGDK